MLDDSNLWRSITLGAVALGQTAFVVLYFFFPWRKTFLGRALFFKALVLAVLTDAFMVTRTFPLGNTDVVFVVLYALLAVGVWWQFTAFLRVWRQGKRDNPNADSEGGGE